MVPAIRVTTDVSDSSKGAVGGRSSLQLTPVFEEEEEAEKPVMGIDILTPENLTKDGNPAVVVQTESWYDTYGTQFFVVDQVNGTIYAIKDDGQWEPTNEKATIDTDTHHIFMSTTPLAGNKMGSQSLSTDITPGNKSNQSLPLAESTRTPGYQGQTPKSVELLASAKARQLEDRTSIALMDELLDEVMQEEQESIIKELRAAEEVRQKGLEEAEALKKATINYGGPNRRLNRKRKKEF